MSSSAMLLSDRCHLKYHDDGGGSGGSEDSGNFLLFTVISKCTLKPTSPSGMGYLSCAKLK